MSTVQAKKDPVRTYFVPINRIGANDIRQMYALYSSFYENTSLDIFLTDLAKKSGVILVSRKEDGRIVGFSTQTFFNLVVDGKRVRGIFSGDTIVEPAYWGNNALANTFYRRLIIERIKQPFVPFYWFLISKGYKTYLLMTNNFYNYYPKVNGNRPGMDERFRRITEAYCDALFPEAFDREKMVLDFGNTYVRLKGDVADITPELAAANKHIGFFDKVNPGWREGHEVPCLAACDYESLFRSSIDVPWKWIKKHILGTHRRPGTELDPKLARSNRAAAKAAAAAQADWLADDEDTLKQGGAS